MKTYLCRLILLFLLSCQIQSKPHEPKLLDNSIIDEKISHLLDKYRNEITKGKWIFPSLDPMMWKNESFHYVNEKLDSDFLAEFTAQLNGFSNYQVLDVKTKNENEFKIVLLIEHSDCSVNYSIKGQLGKSLPVNGNGYATSSQINLTATLSGKIGKDKNGFMNLDQFSVITHLDSVTFDVHGLAGGPIYDKIISSLASRFGAFFVNTNEEFVEQQATRIMMKIFNPTVNRYTFDDLMDLINNLN